MGSEPAALVERWRAPLGRVHRLSDREHQVFVLLCYGMSNLHIARRLEVSERTAKQHLAAILAKLEVDSRLQAGIVACLHVLLQDSENVCNWIGNRP